MHQGGGGARKWKGKRVLGIILGNQTEKGNINCKKESREKRAHAEARIQGTRKAKKRKGQKRLRSKKNVHVIWHEAKYKYVGGKQEKKKQ